MFALLCLTIHSDSPVSLHNSSKSIKMSLSERAPLLPQYEQDTTLQAELHQKLHSYQMYRAMSKGYMPSTEQVIINLRTFLSSDVLNKDNPDLSNSGRRLIIQTRQWLQQFMDLLQHKNSEDQIQDLIWFLSKSKITVDVDDLTARAQKSKAKADTQAAYQSLQTVGSLLLTNSDFRTFLGDLNVVGREVFKDTAFAVSSAAEDVGKKVEPSEAEKKTVAKPGADDGQKAPSKEELADKAKDLSKVVANGSADVARTTADSVEGRRFVAERVVTFQSSLQLLTHPLRQTQRRRGSDTDQPP